MGIEIEHKFLVKDDGWRNEASHSVEMRQGYFTSHEACSIRVRLAGEQAFLNIKSATLGVTRTEFEYPIPADDAHFMLDHLCRKPLVEKTRHEVEHAGHVWEVDVFHGDNDGLVVAEIELTDANEAFDLPPWAGEDVSDQEKYYNVCLVDHPFKDWK